MSLFGDFIKTDAGGKILGSVIGLGGGLVLSNQEKQKAKKQGNDAKAIAQEQVKAQELAYKTAQLQLEAAQKGAGSGTKSNTGLYVGLGIGGAVILGLVVYLAVKKQ